MANSLINGTEAGASVPVATSSPAIVPTWGYDAKTGAAKLFDLPPGGALPSGYVDSPSKAGPGSEEPTEENAKLDEDA